jgi:beta-N-acetylhexosaminidase
VESPQGDLQESDFVPFRSLNDAPMAMTAHVVYSAVDLAPATLSSEIIRVIRDEIGFDGLLMTDDISMKALHGDLGKLSRSAIDAGCDVVLHCNGTLEERKRVADAAGRMGPQAQKRAEAVIAARNAPDEIDIEALDSELEALLMGADHG